MNINSSCYLLVDPDHSLESFHGVMYSMLLSQTQVGSGIRGVDYSERWSDGERIIEWIEVGKLACRFVWFFSPDPTKTKAYLVEKLNAKSAVELIELASRPNIAHDELVDLLYQVGYMIEFPIAKAVTLFESKMQDTVPTIRRAALNGYMIRHWPCQQLKDIVVRIGSNDPDKDVRRTAQAILEL